jgi:hypothetical protein
MKKRATSSSDKPSDGVPHSPKNLRLLAKDKAAAELQAAVSLPHCQSLVSETRRRFCWDADTTCFNYEEFPMWTSIEEADDMQMRARRKLSKVRNVSQGQQWVQLARRRFRPRLVLFKFSRSHFRRVPRASNCPSVSVLKCWSRYQLETIWISLLHSCT